MSGRAQVNCLHVRLRFVPAVQVVQIVLLARSPLTPTPIPDGLSQPRLSFDTKKLNSLAHISLFCSCFASPFGERCARDKTATGQRREFTDWSATGQRRVHRQVSHRPTKITFRHVCHRPANINFRHVSHRPTKIARRYVSLPQAMEESSQTNKSATDHGREFTDK